MGAHSSVRAHAAPNNGRRLHYSCDYPTSHRRHFSCTRVQPFSIEVAVHPSHLKFRKQDFTGNFKLPYRNVQCGGRKCAQLPQGPQLLSDIVLRFDSIFYTGIIDIDRILEPYLSGYPGTRVPRYPGKGTYVCNTFLLSDDIHCHVAQKQKAEISLFGGIGER